MMADNAAPAIHGEGEWFINQRPMPPPAVCPNWFPDWNQPAARPRRCVGVLCTISPSVANAMNVAATLVRSTRSDTIGTVRTDSGTVVSARSPTETVAIASQYHRFLVSV